MDNGPVVAMYRDGEDPSKLVEHFNNLCGAYLINPRADLHGEFQVKDIRSLQIVGPVNGNYAAIALVTVFHDPTIRRTAKTVQLVGTPVARPSEEKKPVSVSQAMPELDEGNNNEEE